MKKVTMKTLKLQLALVACAMGMAVQSHAQMYDIIFTGGSSAANGQIDVVGGFATSGYLDVTAGANQGTYNLVSLTSPLNMLMSPGRGCMYFQEITLSRKRVAMPLKKSPSHLSFILRRRP